MFNMSNMDFESESSYAVDSPCKGHHHGKLAYSFCLSVSTMTLGSLAFLSNFLFLITVAKHQRLRNTHLRMLLVTLSVIDAMIALFYTSLGVRWFADALDHTIGIHIEVAIIFRFPFQFVSCLIITVISVERYLTIKDPVKQVGSSSFKASALSAGAMGLCVIAFLYTLAVVFFVLIFHGKWTSNALCVTSYDKEIAGQELHEPIISLKKANMTFIVSCILVAIEVITVAVSVSLSVMIYRMLGQLPSAGEESHRLHLREQNNLTKMVIVNTGLFCFCLSLSDVFTCVYFSLQETNRFNNSVHYITVTVVVTLINSLLNPIVYNAFGSIYRQAFLDTYPYFRRCMPRLHERVPREDHSVTLATMSTT